MSSSNFSNLHEKYKKDPSYQGDNTLFTKKDIESASKNLEQIEKQPLSERINIITPILCEGGSMMIFGEAGVGKSYFTMNLAYALSSGGNFLKYGVPVPQKVAYFDGELGEDDVHRYLNQIIQGQGASYFKENIVISSFDQFPNQHIPRIEVDTNVYYEYLMDNGFHVAIWDNLATCTDIDENDPKAWKPIQKLILKLRKHKVSTIFVHHAGTDKGKDRGITARRDILHTVISLQKIEDLESIDNRIKVVYQKGRHLNGEDKKPYEAVHKVDGTWTIQEIERSTYETVIAYFLVGASGVKIAEKVGITPQMVSKYKQKGVFEGVLQVGVGGRVTNCK